VSGDPRSLALELAAAYARGNTLVAPFSSGGGFNLDTAYGVEAEFVRLRRAEGHRTVGRKVGYASKAMWRVHKLETLVWAHMYDDTVQYASANHAALVARSMSVPKIEPEIVFKLKTPIDAGTTGAEAVLNHVEWLALDFEIIDCPFPDWTFKPSDFVAAYGLHRALVVGEPREVRSSNVDMLARELATFTVRLLKNDQVVEEGAGKNALDSPALCLGELAMAIAKRMPDERLAAGELVSSGTLTKSQPIGPGETWIASVDGIDLPPLTLTM
jgi:2-keto-4-pentenoate hydratase